jgi:3-oxoacyl-[acyl-carrier protein] reductase
MDLGLRGRVAIAAAASSGLGFATARELACARERAYFSARVMKGQVRGLF